MTVCRSQNMVYKRRREEPVPESDDDSELDEDEKEALVHCLEFVCVFCSRACNLHCRRRSRMKVSTKT